MNYKHDKLFIPEQPNTQDFVDLNEKKRTNQKILKFIS